MEIFKLSKPITLVNNTEINELNLDFDALTYGDLKTANRIAKMVSGGAIAKDATEVDAISLSPRFDSNLRTAISWCAAIKGTQGLRVEDVLKLSMVDALCLSEEAMTSYLFR